MIRLVVSGTDTGIGKTVLSAAIAATATVPYWKPIQSGLVEGEDVNAAAALGARHVRPSTYRLSQPLSPHRAAELDGVTIDFDQLVVPAGAIVIEGAGGVLTPVTREILFADLFANWNIPVLLVARTSLGTINHSLLSIEALRARRVPILGIAFVGDHNGDNESTIATMGRVRRLGRLPWLDPLNAARLAQAFTSEFRIEDFEL